jgi:glycerol uptake facilitator-like aquaporin
LNVKYFLISHDSSHLLQDNFVRILWWEAEEVFCHRAPRFPTGNSIVRPATFLSSRTVISFFPARVKREVQEKRVMSQPAADEMKDLSPLEDQEEDNTVAKSLKHVEAKKEVVSVTRLEELPTRSTGKAASTASTAGASAGGFTSPTRELGATPGAASAASAATPKPGALSEEQQARLIATQRAALKRLRSEFDFIAVPDWVVLHPLLGCYLAESIGTFMFALTAALCAANNPMLPGQNQTNVVCLPIGFMLMCMVFTFGYISGGHFNPAVTIAVFFSRKLELKKAVGYIVCQCAAAVGSGLVAMIIQGSVQNIAVPNASNVTAGVFSELIYTFAVSTVVLHVGYSVQKANFFYGFAIGMTITAGVAASSSIGGGVFNPAIATGLQLAYCLTGQCSNLLTFWVFWVAPVLGAALAAIIFCNLHQPQKGLSDANV